VLGNAKGLSGLMSQYAQDSDTEDSDVDVDTSMYNVEAGQFNSNLIVVMEVEVVSNTSFSVLSIVLLC